MKMATVLNRVAQVIRDLKTLKVIEDEDISKFYYNKSEKAYHITIITLSNKSLITIVACFKQEFQDKDVITEFLMTTGGNIFMCRILAD